MIRNSLTQIVNWSIDNFFHRRLCAMHSGQNWVFQWLKLNPCVLLTSESNMSRTSARDCSVLTNSLSTSWVCSRISLKERIHLIVQTLNPLHPNISIYILYNLTQTLPLVLTRRPRLIIKSLQVCESFIKATRIRDLNESFNSIIVRKK